MLGIETDCLKQESKAALQSICKSSACLKRFEKQKKFLKSKGRDMVCHSLKTLDKLEEAEEKEKREEEERKRAAETAAATAAAEAAIAAANPLDPFARIEVPLLLLRVWDGWDFSYETLPAFRNS